MMKFGSHLLEEVKMYPDDCLQNLITQEDWWVKNDENTLCRGALIYSFITHVDQIPYTFSPVGRTEATQHNSAIVKVAPLKVNQPLKQTELPVAAMALNHGEVWAANRAKRRPCVIIGTKGMPIEKSLIQGKPKHTTAPTILVAPFYGIDKNTHRAGYKPEFVERVRHCEYPQFMWDRLPISGNTKESILRLDHLQPIGTHHNSYKLSEFKLSNTGLDVIDDLYQWLIQGGVNEDSLINLYRAEIESYF